jgi:hypothetical protein
MTVLLQATTKLSAFERSPALFWSQNGHKQIKTLELNNKQTAIK